MEGLVSVVAFAGGDKRGLGHNHSNYLYPLERGFERFFLAR